MEDNSQPNSFVTRVCNSTAISESRPIRSTERSVSIRAGDVPSTPARTSTR